MGVTSMSTGLVADSARSTAGAAPTLADDFSRVLSLGNLLPNIYYWEQGADGRITCMSGHAGSPWLIHSNKFIGKTPQELGGVPQGKHRNWTEANQLFENRTPFADLVLRYVGGDGQVTFLSHAGEPRFDAKGTFLGHRGVFRDITRRVGIERRLVLERQTAQLLAESPSAVGTANATLRNLCEALDWLGGAYWEVTRDTSGRTIWRCAESFWHPSRPPARAHDVLSPTALEPGDPLASMLETGMPHWIPDLKYAAKCKRTARMLDAGFRSAFLVPIRTPAGTVGVFELFGPLRERQEPQIIEAGLYIGHMLGQAIERQRLHDERQYLRAAIDLLPDSLYIVDRERMRFIYSNETACRLSEYTAEELLHLGPSDLLPRTRKEYEDIFDNLIADPKNEFTDDTVATGKLGRSGPVEIHSRALKIDGRWCIVSVSRDVLQRKRAEAAQLRISRMYAALSASNEAVIHSRSPDELFDKICRAAVEGAGFLGATVLLPTGDHSAEVAAHAGLDLLGRKSLVFPAEHTARADLAVAAFRSKSPAVAHEFSTDERTAAWRTAAGPTRVASAGAFPLLRDGQIRAILLLHSSERKGFSSEAIALLERMSENVAFGLDHIAHEEERRRGQERITYMASHDALTGLANRVMFGELLGHAIQSARRYGRKFAVMFIDLDRFKQINDSLGHAAGDLLLQEIATRLKDCLRGSDVLARNGGDEFVVLMQEAEETAQVATVARKLLSAALKPVLLNGQECRVTASVGISMFPTDAQDEQSLLKNADMAMYHAKAEGKNNFQFFSADISSKSLEKLTLESHLRGALEANELALHYQPKVDIQSGAITGVEALLRWTSPALGFVSPAQFIPLAEETGLIIPIGRWVLRTACEQSAAWARAGLPVVSMAVNLSSRQFSDESLVSDLATVLRETGIAPETLEMEITESMVITDPERAMAVLREMKALGVRLAIDDFGTGYSSLGQLKRFPVDTLKVDRSFIRDLPGNADDRAITEAIISMGKSLSLKVVAEGVETVEQLDFLRASACDEMQGFLFSKAIPAADFARMLRDHTARG
jgi:diguanylate cyclase (GGDEF)-like protein/PAS domain S-box-containing protein